MYIYIGLEPYKRKYVIYKVKMKDIERHMYLCNLCT